MPTRLVSLDGLAPIPTDRVPIVAGRHLRCDARPDQPLVSRHRCDLFRYDDGLVAGDLGSSNGTRINGLRIEPRVRLSAQKAHASKITLQDSGRPSDFSLAQHLTTPLLRSPGCHPSAVSDGSMRLETMPPGLAPRIAKGD